MTSETEKSYHERVLRVLVHIQQHLDDVLDLDSLAQIAHFSPHHFHRVFRGMVGEGVAEHIRRLRLERAAHRLKLSDQPVTQIAFDAGYETHESFTRAFRGMFGEPPSSFRETHPLLPQADAPSGVHYAPDGGVVGFKPLQKGAATMEVRIEKIEQKRVAFMRHVGPYQEVGATWQKMMAFAGPRGMCRPGMMCMGLCHDDPEVTPPDKIRYDVCLTVGDDFQPEGEVGVQDVFGGEYAVTRLIGPYEQLANTYAELCGQWLPSHGREPRPGPTVEVYHNSPQTTSPENLVTDVYVPLQA
jgi:AraC family transcriptional regulator